MPNTTKKPGDEAGGCYGRRRRGNVFPTTQERQHRRTGADILAPMLALAQKRAHGARSEYIHAALLVLRERWKAQP